jgi:hypothetical protein
VDLKFGERLFVVNASLPIDQGSSLSRKRQGGHMATAIARLVQPQGTVRVVQRAAPRLAAQRRGQISSAQGGTALAMISETSLHGCSVQCASGWLRPGRFVCIGIEDNAPLQAIVRWVREDHAGLDFLQAVPSHRSDWQALIAMDS